MRPRYSPSTSAEIETTSTAIYAQGTLQLGIISESLDKFSLTLGVRRTEDEEEGARFATKTSPIACTRNCRIPTRYNRAARP